MNSDTSDINTRLDDIATRRQDIQERISALQSSLSSTIGKKQCEEIEYLKTVDKYLRRSDSFLKHQNYPSRRQLFNSPLASTSSCKDTLTSNNDSDTDSDGTDDGIYSDPNPDVSDYDSHSVSDFNTLGSDTNSDLDADDYVADSDNHNIDSDDHDTDSDDHDTDSDDHDTDSEDHDTNPDADPEAYKFNATENEAGNSISFNSVRYAANEPEVRSSSTEMEIHLWEPDVLDCGTETLRGAHCGRFGTANCQSIVAYGPHHLSSWSSFGEYTQTHLTELLPRCTIKRLVPLSPNALGIVADLENTSDGCRDSEVLLFNINAALNEEARGTPLSHNWSNLSSCNRKISIIKEMDTSDDCTFFISGEKNNTDVVVHSFMHADNTFRNARSKPLDAQLKNCASALGYDSKYNRAIAGTTLGQLSVVDVLTGKHICGGRLYESGDTSKGLNISSLAICPTSPHLMLATCRALTDQIKILDLRMPISAVLTYGKSLVSEYPEEIVPAWNPFNGVIVAPFNRQDTGGSEDMLTIFDTRFTGFLESASKEHNPLNTGTWSISFGTEQEIGFPTMVTAGDNGTLGVFNYMDL